MPDLDEKTGKPMVDDEGNPILVPKYPFHELRHAAAALFHDAGFQPKRLQEVMGHATLAMTMDTYAYLFENTEGECRRAR